MKHPFHQGYEAHFNGLSEYDNPYTNEQRPADRAAWEHGRSTAEADEKLDF